ncbi:MAG: hypothetical protein MUD14_28120 [Hydrococcus sp. Prado102]|jgi:hypothetical protein|nr:hypothetical protein [Hydrococcus sp. Prado102]
MNLRLLQGINSIAKEFSLADFSFVIEEQIFQQLLRESEEFFVNSNLDDVQGFLRRDIWNSHLDFGTLISRVFLLEEDYAAKLNINLDRKTQEWLQCLKNLLESCGWLIPFEDVCLVCDRPITMSLDEQNSLHAEGKPALQYADGYKLYSYHGVTIAFVRN